MLDGSTFCSHCGKPTATAPVAVKKSSPLDSVLKIVGAVVIVGFLLLIVIGKLFGPHIPASTRAPSNAQNPLATIFRQTVTQSILSGQTMVAAHQYKYWALTITPDMVDAQLEGNFHTDGGTGNDIQAVIADASEFENWKNGHPAQVLYSSERTTNGQFSVSLAPGNYILAFSNAFSLLSAKMVTGEITLRYLK